MSIHKKYHPPGTPPGTLSEEENSTMMIRWIEYGSDFFKETLSPTKEESFEASLNNYIDWIDITGKPNIAYLQTIGDVFGLHPLTLEDVINTGQRPKVDFHPDYTFIVLSYPSMNQTNVVTQQISIFITKNYLLSFCAGDGHVFEPIRERLRQGVGKIRSQGIGYLLYLLMDVVIDSGFPLIEQMGESIANLETAIIEHTEASSVGIIHQYKNDMLLLRRSLWPERDVVNRLLQSDVEWIDNSLRPYLNDCYDHVIQLIDLLEIYREMLANLLELHVSSLGIRLNEVMRVLTLISTIFIPLTFIVGVYGMNFDHMPELRWSYGYAMIWGLMTLVVIVMLIIFKRKRWI